MQLGRLNSYGRKKLQGGFMNRKFKTIVFGGLVAGSLMMSAVPVMAWDWPWYNRNQRTDNRPDYRTDHRPDYRADNRGWDNRSNREWNNRSDHRTNNQEWDNRWGRGKDYDEYQQARQQALYDASHGASRKKIAEDDARADAVLDRMRHRH